MPKYPLMPESRTPNRGRGYSGLGSPMNKKVPLKGLFANNVWNCNCNPRLPAQHLQTKNGGKNHGRWFYTCQKPQPTRCDFFLWDDDAKPREAAVLLDNARSEPGSDKAQTKATTEERHLQSGYPGSLMSPSKVNNDEAKKAIQTSPGALNDCSMEAYPKKTDQADLGSQDNHLKGWSTRGCDINLESSAHIARNEVSNPPETPRRPIVAASASNSGKRKAHEMLTDSSGLATPSTSSTLKGDDADVFATSSRSHKMTTLFASHLQTPSPIRFRDGSAEPVHPEQLSAEIYNILQRANITLPADAKGEINELCRRELLHIQGLVQGRDLSRKGIIHKQEKITELQSIIQGLQAERENARAVIRHLRTQIGDANGAKKLDEYT